MLPIFGIVLLLFGALILYQWLPERTLYSRLQHHGKDTVAAIQQVTYYRYQGHASKRLTYDINDANLVELKVRYVADGRAYTATIQTTFSLERNDHAALKDAITHRKVLVRYLPSDPQQVSFTDEFTDPDDNPYFGGK